MTKVKFIPHCQTYIHIGSTKVLGFLLLSVSTKLFEFNKQAHKITIHMDSSKIMLFTA